MKYVGSKNKIAKYIVPILQKIINSNGIQKYIEPFCGGCNVIDKIKCNKLIAYDNDIIPISIFKHYTERPQDLEILPNNLTKDFYYYIRDTKEFPDWYRSSILLFGSYNSRVYGGCYGAQAITKDGNVRNYYQEAINNFQDQLKSLPKIKFSRRDYRKIKASKSLIYCDPPYQEGIGYKDNFYHEEFWNWVRKNLLKNIIVVSENSAPEDFVCIWQQETTSSMNNRNKIDKVEKLFIHKSQIKYL